MVSSDDNRLDFRAIADDGRMETLPEVFREYWPGYRRWMQRALRQKPRHGVEQLRRHMPELVPIFESLCARLEGGDDVARFLTLYDPPPMVRACAQLVLDLGSGPRMIRTYDHHPALFDAIVLHADWGKVKTLALADCIWGALDGINEHGCAVALAFGGRNVIGPGFAAPIIVRYLLQTCRAVAEVCETLARLPVYMPYTFVAVDANGAFTTAFLSPDRPATFVQQQASTNHQQKIEWSAYARYTQSALRLSKLEALIGNSPNQQQVEAAFVRPPLWRYDYKRGSGTLYVVEYSPVDREIRLIWPGREEKFKMAGFRERTFTIDLPR